MEHARRDVVYGHRRNRRRSETSRRLEDVGARLLDGSSSLQPRGGDVNFMMDDEVQGRIQATYESVQHRWRAVDSAHLVALVRADGDFENGVLVERPDESTSGDTHAACHADPLALTIPLAGGAAISLIVICQCAVARRVVAP
jgi:hypothetical protein